MIKNFKDKVAVVTGAGCGIGRSLALAFAKRGMKIVIADIVEETLNDVADELTAGGAEVLKLVVDVSDRDQVAKMADATYERFGGAHILCNNAGIGGGGPMQLLELADWDWMLGINLFGVIYGIKSFLPRMVESGEECHIVNTASLAGHLPGDGAPYSPSKFAVVAISEALKRECFSTKVGVSVLCPGYVDTQIMKNADSFRTGRSDIYQPSEEIREMWKPMRDNADMFLSTGMSPDTIAEKVIIAIEHDILNVITHPEYIPAIESRFHAIRHDTSKLDQLYADSIGRDKKSASVPGRLKTYNHESPGFSIQYPGNWVQIKPGPLMTNAVFIAVLIPGADLVISIFDKSEFPSGSKLENATSYTTGLLENLGTDVTVISDQMTTLKDGTPANEGILEYRNSGIVKVKILTLTVANESQFISIILGAISEVYQEDFKNILRSFQFE